MTNDDNNIKHYTADDIHRYWQGKLSPQEMHAMEKAAMDDPFLADALEGYANMREETITADVKYLRSRMQERVAGTAVIPIKRNRRWMSVAAAVILLCGTGVLTYTIFLKSEKSASKLTQATNETKDTEASAPAVTSQKTDTPATTVLGATNDTAKNGELYMVSERVKSLPKNASGNIAKTDDAAKDTPGFAAARPDAKSKEESKTDDRKYESTGDLTLQKQARAKDSVVLGYTKRGEDLSKNLEGQAAGIKVTPNKQAAPDLSRDNAERFAKVNSFNGRVLDSRNAPIANATVRNLRNNAYVATDKDGNFQVKSADTLVDIAVSSAGFDSRQLTMRNNQPQQNVVLEESDIKLQEVIVTASGSKKRRESRSSTTLSVYVMDAAPVVGWDEYSQYIDDNKRIDSTARPVKGEVVVLFTVSKTGKLSNFSIEKSLGKSQDAEAIRLIKDGPAWKVLKNKKTRARVIIPF